VEAGKKPMLTIVPSSVTKTIRAEELALLPDEREAAIASYRALGGRSEDIPEVVPLTELELPRSVRLSHFCWKLGQLLDVIEDEGAEKSWRRLRGKELIDACDDLRRCRPAKRALSFAPDDIERMTAAATSFAEIARHRLDMDDQDPIARTLGGLEIQLSSLRRSSGSELTPAFSP
jgi:hypothetical protein